MAPSPSVPARGHGGDGVDPAPGATWLRLELEDELFRPANDVARPDQILLGHHGVGKAAEDRADHGLQLEAGERAAEADVGPPPEGEVLTRVRSGDVDLVRRRAPAVLVPVP